MRMLYLLLVTALGIKLQEQASLQSGSEARAAVREFIQSDSLGKMMFSFAQLEMHASGAVDILIEVLKAFGRQQEERLAEENKIWQARMGDHNARRIAYESLVNEGQLQINRDRKRLVQEYEPRSVEVDNILASLKSKMEKNGKAKKDAEALRTEQNQQFTMTANEISDAIKATDETLEYIKRCSQSGSFIQEKQSLSDKLMVLKKRAEGSTEYMGSMLTALTDISERQNFADREVQKQLVDLLQSLRSYFVETLQKAYTNEDQQKQLHEERIQQLEKEYGIFEKQYSDAYQEREQKSLQIEDTNKLLDTRSKELQGYQDRLTTENNNFSQQQKIHDDLVSAINSEIGFIEKALNVLTTSAFNEELQNAINMAK